MDDPEEKCHVQSTIQLFVSGALKLGGRTELYLHSSNTSSWHRDNLKMEGYRSVHLLHPEGERLVRHVPAYPPALVT
jgi:hypothetical protein